MPFSPTDIPGIVAWYDASNAGSITSSGGKVSQWNDLSGNANHLTQGTSGNQPTTGTRTQNGLNAIDFLARPDYMGCALTAVPSTRFVWAVVKIDTTAADQGVVGATAADSAEWRVFTSAGTGQDLLESATAHHIPTSQTAATTSTRIVAMQYVSTGNLTAYLNGAQDGNALAVSWSFSGAGTVLVGTGTTVAANLDGYICELVIVDTTVVSAADRASLFTYGNDKWAVYTPPFSAASGAVSNVGRVLNGPNLTLPVKGHGDIAIGGWASLTGTHVQLSGHGDIAVTGRGPVQLTLPFRSHGDIAVTGTATEATSLAVTGRGNIAVTGRAGENTQIDLRGRGNLANTGRVGLTEAVALAGHGDVATTGRAGEQLALRFSGHGDVSTAGNAGLLVPVVVRFTGAGAIALGAGHPFLHAADNITDVCALLAEDGDEILTEAGVELFDEACADVLPPAAGSIRPPRHVELPTIRKTHIRIRVTILTTSIWSTGVHLFTLTPRSEHRSHIRTRNAHRHELERTQAVHGCRRTHLHGDVRTESRFVRPKSYHRELMMLAEELL